MPDRIFRDEILASPRYWQLSSDTARMLFFHLGLRADDLGIFRAANYTIRQECFGADHKPGTEALSKLLAELADADLIRMWQEDGADYGFIPRWKQRLRIVKSKFPLPPPQIRDKTIIELISKMSDGRQASVGHMSAEVKRSEEKRSKPKAFSIPIERARGKNVKTVSENLSEKLTTKPKTKPTMSRADQLSYVESKTKK